MPSYDFKQLSPHDFEQLCRDLIQARDGLTLESFKSGRDQGIDFRHARANHDTIVQCKHYLKSTFTHLRRAAEQEASRLGTTRNGEVQFQ